MDRLKIAIITPGVYPIPGNKSSSVELVVQKTSNLLQKDVDVIIFGKKTKNQSFIERQGNITYYRFQFNNKTYIPEVIEQLQQDKPDIIQIENRPRFVKIIRKAIPDAKIILFLHSVTFISPPYMKDHLLINYLNQTNAIVVNSQFLRNYLIEKTNGNANKIYVNHLGVNTDQFKPKWQLDSTTKLDILRKKLGISNNKVLLYVGRLVEIKGVHHILEAMPDLIKADPSIRLIIAGSPTEQKTYSDYLRNLAEDVKDHVVFTSFIPNDKVQELFQISDLLVVPSAQNEAFGLVNLEAMSTGTPVIATKSGGMPEIIDHGITGLLIDPSNVREELTKHIINLLSNPRKIQQMGKESVVRVSNYFTWQHTADRQLMLYRLLLEG
ncbi:glycosyltransferase family 4 protein [Neobacillus niacini]|uniref:glycosyltransferase family 4 protein n=1 Tax=Neobacillus niacini TaxID=86668 RepID=UPI0007ABF4AC|nr:glycosyltransferase family 4 protein [Neobacillus niacini]MEC1520434.1 glycosyltransferase family 4 protein [Neobacillus niacini]